MLGLMTRMRLSGSCQAVNTAWAAVRVDLTHWRVQLRMTRLEREARTMDWVGSGRKRKRSRAKATGSSEWQSSRSWGIGVLECVEVTKGADDTVASLGEILESFHDGDAELPPVGGVGIVGGWWGGVVAEAGSEIGALGARVGSRVV